jgi:hypothetical protein
MRKSNVRRTTMSLGVESLERREMLNGQSMLSLLNSIVAQADQAAKNAETTLRKAVTADLAQVNLTIRNLDKQIAWNESAKSGAIGPAQNVVDLKFVDPLAKSKLYLTGLLSEPNSVLFMRTDAALKVLAGVAADAKIEAAANNRAVFNALLPDLEKAAEAVPLAANADQAAFNVNPDLLDATAEMAIVSDALIGQAPAKL